MGRQIGDRRRKLRDAVVEDLQMSVRSHAEVAGLQIAVNDPLPVGSGKALQQLRPEVHRLRLRQGPSRDSIAQGFARHVFHDEQIAIPHGLEVVNRGDVGVIQA
jgi:hypothetical protein